MNLLLLLTVLSLVPERMTNVVKLRHDSMKIRRTRHEVERERERRIQASNLIIGVLFALLVKANLFELLEHLDHPWRTLGWVRPNGAEWVRAPEMLGLGSVVYTVFGCTLTGLALGFGSKFWHDLLGTIYEVRDLARRGRSSARTHDDSNTSSTATPTGSEA